MHIVACLTTTPNRISKEILGTCLERLESIPMIDEVILTVPRVMRRTGKSYDILTIFELVKGLSKIRINLVDEDDGPISKLSGCLDHTPDSLDTYVIILDDDVLYNPKTFARRVHKHITEHPNAATALFGRTSDTTPLYEGPSDVLEGFSTIMTRRNNLPKSRADLLKYIDEYFHNDPDALLTDDLIISTWFSNNGVPKIVYKMDIVDKFLAEKDQDSLIHENFRYRNKAMFHKYRDHLKVCNKLSFSTNAFFVVFVLVLIVVFMCIIAYFRV